MIIYIDNGIKLILEGYLCGEVASIYWEDARADISLSGDGCRLLGLKVSLNNDGSLLAVGDCYYDAIDGNNGLTGDGGSNNGQIHICEVLYGVEPRLYSCEIIATGAAGDHAGSSIMIAKYEPCVLYGSTQSGTGQNGTATVAYCDDNQQWVTEITLQGEAPEDNFGFSVGISSDAKYIAVGARFKDHIDDSGKIK